MPQFSFRATVTLREVVVIVEAENEIEARAKAEKGDWEDAEYFTADRADFTIGRFVDWV